MADDFAAVAIAQHSITPAADSGRSLPIPVPSLTVADRAERGIELVSRWAGILTFVSAVAAIGWLIV